MKWISTSSAVLSDTATVMGPTSAPVLLTRTFRFVAVSVTPTAPLKLAAVTVTSPANLDGVAV